MNMAWLVSESEKTMTKQHTIPRRCTHIRQQCTARLFVGATSPKSNRQVKLVQLQVERHPAAAHATPAGILLRVGPADDHVPARRGKVHAPEGGGEAVLEQFSAAAADVPLLAPRGAARRWRRAHVAGWCFRRDDARFLAALDDRFARTELPKGPACSDDAALFRLALRYK